MHSRFPIRDTNNSADDEFGFVYDEPSSKKVKTIRKNIIRRRVLADKIRDEQWATLRLKALWKKNPAFAKWWKRNIDTKSDDHRYYPSKFRGVYGPKD